ncbi:MAG: hypothetical protein LBK69_07110 [Syntrophomonadaceae bacterium]|nr:hypothetical protein [Syntrophomonadaceae bacterium]
MKKRPWTRVVPPSVSIGATVGVTILPSISMLIERGSAADADSAGNIAVAIITASSREISLRFIFYTSLYFFNFIIPSHCIRRVIILL